MHNIDKLTKSHQVISKTFSFAAIQDFITDTQIKIIYRQFGHAWRQRLLPPPTTIRSMVYRSFHRNRSIKTLLTDIAAADINTKIPTESAWEINR